ncbi:hypothetical protein [Algibacter mikhailovii]|uniref:hypothetical protein n=1 Tax=Algibacter mikhailovii TaxID=425498 RepID=UPI002494DD85|nr:hypothetical protein [Algibacter mikhailovii]
MISLFTFVILFIPVLLLSSQIENSILQLVVTALGIIGLFGILLYFSYGRLNVTFENDTLHFEWQKKLLFEYAKIPDIELNEIKCLVIDQGQILRKIITDKVEITLGNNRPNNILKSDSQSFINFLSKEIQGKEIIDSWDIWVKKGLLKWALRINTMILIVVVGILGFFAATKGIEKIPPASFFMLIFLLPQMILYQKQMKNKIKN